MIRVEIYETTHNGADTHSVSVLYMQFISDYFVEFIGENCSLFALDTCLLSVFQMTHSTLHSLTKQTQQQVCTAVQYFVTVLQYNCTEA